MMKDTVQRPFDRLAIALSGLCVVHCLLTPVALVLFPVLAATSVADDHFHMLLLGLVLPASLVALVLGCRRHKDHLVISLGGIGLVLLMFTAIGGHAVLGERGERWSTVLGSVTLALGHLRNHYLCRRNACDA
jgi:cytochrome c biogenesis factor